eukprot:UN06941
MIAALTIFALSLTGLFCCCICMAVWFCINTKRKSRLRKISKTSPRELKEYDTVPVQSVQTNHKMDDTLDGVPQHNIIQMGITEESENIAHNM